MRSYFIKSALMPEGWRQNVRLTTEHGVFKSITPDSQQQDQDQALEVIIPAMPNVHSHVFQRAMAGLSEFKGQGADSFWSWRDLMYQLANQLDQETLYQVAKTCYREMRQAGYASVCEFHYVHRSKSDDTDFFSHSEVLLKAAAEVGLPITLLPVLYAFSAVGDQPLKPEQKRFELNVDQYIQLFNHLQPLLQTSQQLGICFHSIRAVNQPQMQAVIDALPNDVPIHIHIAEQQAEIDQAMKHHGMRPVEWLYQHFKVDQRWSLVHATHLNQHEIELIADSGAVAVLCPLTEANLGDGIFPMTAFKEQGGTWAIGSDSHIEIQPQQELKMLEYSQRLQCQQRNVCCDNNQPHVGTWLWLQALTGGNHASGMPASGIQLGHASQVIELQCEEPLVPEKILDSWIFSDRIQATPYQL